MREDIIFEVRNMHKAFGPTIALKDVSIQLRRGEIDPGTVHKQSS